MSAAKIHCCLSDLLSYKRKQNKELVILCADYSLQPLPLRFFENISDQVTVRHKDQANNIHIHTCMWHTVSISTLLFEPAPLLNEAHEGSDSCPRADHDHWVGGFEGQAELRLADVHGNGGLVAVVSDQFVHQPVGGNTLVNAASLGFVLHHYSTDVDAVGVNLQNRGVTNRSLL